MQEYSNRIQLFWEWFQGNAHLLYDTRKNNEDVFSELDKQIDFLGPFDWEIGPVDNDVMYLAISPNLDRHLLETTKTIISQAPKIDNWRFYHSKPKKRYSATWYMLNDVGKSIKVDTSLWKYILYKFEDGTYDVEVSINEIDGNENTKFLAVEIAIVNLIGEEKFLTTVKQISLTEKDDFRGISFRLLDDHLNKEN